MATMEKVGEAKTGFEGLNRKELAEKRLKLAHQWADALKGDATDKGDGSFVEASVSNETMEAVKNIQVEYDLVDSTISAMDKAAAADKYREARDDLTKGTHHARDAQHKLDAQALDSIVKAGHNKYAAGGDVTRGEYCEHPGEVDLGQPCIAWNGQAGRNEVMPFPFVPAKKNANSKDGYRAGFEASFRNADIIAADKVGLYDPLTGAKVDGHNAPVGRYRTLEATIDTSDYTLTTIGGELYVYLVQENEFISICEIIQSPNINRFEIIRRRNVPTAGAVAEDGQIPISDSVFDPNLTLDPQKYGFIKQYTYETTMQREPWMMAALMAMDGGIGLRNGIGQDLVTGTGTNEIEGVLTWAKSAAGSAVRLPAIGNANFVGGSNQIGIPQITAIATSIPKEYMKSPAKRMVMSLDTWSGLMALVDGDNRKLLRDSNMDVDDMSLSEFNSRILLDENMDSRTFSAADIPVIFGDFQESICVLLSGGPRVDFSTEFGFQNDRLSLRFLQHADMGIKNVVAWKAQVLN